MRQFCFMGLFFLIKDFDMEQQNEKPFAEVLQAIIETEPMPVHLLFRLSDLSTGEWSQFEEAWRRLGVDKRRVMVRHLADLSEDNFTVDFAPVFLLALADNTESVRLAALDGLWDASDTKLIPILINVVKNDTAVDVRAAAAGALAHFVMMAEWGEISERFSHPIVDAMLDAYDSDETPVSVRRAAVETLGASSHARVPQIIRASYESDSQEMQLSAIFAMGNSADPRWLHIVIGEMESDDERMREMAAYAAGVIGRSDAITGLADLVEDDAYEVQLAAIHALGQIGGEASQQILEELLDEEEKAHLHEVAEEALEEMDWSVGELNLFDLDSDEWDSEYDKN